MPAALEGIDWAQAKLDFLQLRAEGVGFIDSLTEIADRLGVKYATVDYHSRKDKWAATVRASRGVVDKAFARSIDVAVEQIAQGMGNGMLDQLQEFRKVKAVKPTDLLAKAQALKTLSEVRSRYNPDGQEKAGGVSLFQVNVNSEANKPEKQAQVTDVKTVSSESE